ncbi:hypothetical protein [Streptomyces sp. NPDC127072]|uniref:hypothetical protein n=2 Tax=unclassified Streptomyces TaxID=2593676 RepID=UPI00366172B9
MTEYRPEGIDPNTDPVPRDMPDQQVQEGEDPWDVAPRFEPDDGEPAGDVPDTDEAGTARKGASRSDTVHPEDPGAEESPA